MERLLNENRLKQLISIILENTEDDIITIDAKKLEQILDVVNFNMDILFKTKMFKGKKVIVNGDLKLNDKRVKSMGNIIKVIGKLDISHSEIGSLQGVEVTGYVSDYNSKRQRIKEARRRAAKLEEANERRESGDWDLDNEYMDDEGLRANALLVYLESEGYRIRTPEDNEELEELKENLESLKVEENQKLERGEDITDLTAEIESLEEQIEEIENSIDVYNIIPESTHYGLQTFKIYSSTISESNEYAVGTEEEAREEAIKAEKELVQDNWQGLPDWLLQDAIDEEEVLDYFESFYNDDIYDSPESYFDEDDYELTPEDEEKKELLEKRISDLEDRQSEIDSDSEEYDEIQEEIDELQNEIDELEPEITDEMREDKVQERLRDVKRNLSYYMKEFGLDIQNYIDFDELAEKIVDEDGVGHVLGTYDGTEELADFRGETYSIFRVD